MTRTLPDGQFLTLLSLYAGRKRLVIGGSDYWHTGY